MSREAVESARRALVGEVHTGFQTLATAFGADFATDFEGVSVERVAEEGPRPPTQPLLRVVRRSLLH